jgi:hypothetical protein
MFVPQKYLLSWFSMVFLMVFDVFLIHLHIHVVYQCHNAYHTLHYITYLYRSFPASPRIFASLFAKRMLTALRMRSEEKRTPNSACEDSSVLSQTLSRSLPWVHGFPGTERRSAAVVMSTGVFQQSWGNSGNMLGSWEPYVNVLLRFHMFVKDNIWLIRIVN